MARASTCIAALLVILCWMACTTPKKSDSVRIMTYNTHLISPAMRCLPDFLEQSEIETGVSSILTLGSLSAADIAAKFNVTVEEAAALLECIIHADDIAPDEAKIIAHYILEINPDMVAFNEVFDDEAKQILVDRLSGTYPHYIKKVGGDAFDAEDSGLMFFSKFPIVKLPQPPPPGLPMPDYYRFVEYDACAAEDCWAAKGACFIRVQHPVSKVVYPIIFTHLQADYGGDTGANAGDRKEQWADLIGLFKDQLQPGILYNQNTIVLGDLNIQGLKGIWVNDKAENGSVEWREFATKAKQDFLYDGWSSIMPRTLEKNMMTVTDPGITHPSDERLDYILFGREILTEWGCVQHMKIMAPGESDHLAVWADYNRGSDFCSPRNAWENPPFDVYLNAYPHGSTNYDATRIEYPGAMQWFHYKTDKPATVGISVHNAFNPATHKGVAIELYAPHNFSTPIPNYLGEKSFSVDLDDSTLVYVTPKDFYIRVYSPNRDWAGNYEIGVHVHTCTSQDEACRLVVNDPVYYNDLFLAGQALGQDDKAWFQIDVTDTADSGKPQQLTFRCDSTMGNALSLELVDKKTLSPIALNEKKSTSGVFYQAISAEEVGPLGVYFYVKRKNINEALRFRAGWQSNLSRIYGSDITVGGALKMTLSCKDETDGFMGSEAGDDEIHLQFNVDGMGFKQVFSHDYDCNSGGISKTFGNNKKSVRFLENVQVKIIEGDGDGNPDDASATKTIQALPIHYFPPSQFLKEPDEQQKARVQKTKASFKFEDGEYWFEYSISHQIPVDKG